jgi:hypothetical protein
MAADVFLSFHLICDCCRARVVSCFIITLVRMSWLTIKVFVLCCIVQLKIMDYLVLLGNPRIFRHSTPLDLSGIIRDSPNDDGLVEVCALRCFPLCYNCCLHMISGGFRGGRTGRAPPLKFAKHMLYNVN